MSDDHIDIHSGRHPVKFWSGVVAVVVTLTGGSGGVSYTMAQQATESTARATAEATARRLVEAYQIKNNVQLEKLEDKIDENGQAAAEVGRDVDWIRGAIERIEDRQYEERGE